ncbi:UvrD-helicase domain-containing protein [archaeon]|jgi:superfamily I DNA/RNA helicase|nr:UvrD-helicase domain-containing protein [archaeon]
MNSQPIPTYKRDDSQDYLIILKTIQKIPFGVGKKLLIDFLQGNPNNKSIKLNRLNLLEEFGILSKTTKEQLEKIINNLVSNNLLEFVEANNNRFMKYLKLTQKGIKEFQNPTLNSKKLKNNFIFKKTIITDKDREIFKELDFFLNNYNDEQKKAIISSNQKILCIAGAGSGKTTALTKRIEFLVKFKGINPEKILAVTFTRKARQEMITRLNQLNINDVQVETFNSFCEKILQKYGQLIYGRNVKIMSYGNKVIALSGALQNLNLKMNEAIDKYFSVAQKRLKTKEQLASIFMNDCFFILEYFKYKNLDLYDFSEEADEDDKEIAKMIYNICKYLKEYMFRAGLRDYSDQVLDAMKFLTENKEFIPEFEHILVDEYQDVNSTQIKFLNLFNAPNFFSVGDPRQSIFGWRGSDINYILNFEKTHTNPETISLTKNYRSTKNIINFFNESIRDMNLPDLNHSLEDNGKITLSNFDSETQEMNFIINKIQNSTIDKQEIFILARTNRQLNTLSKLMKEKKIQHIIRSEEEKSLLTAKQGEITLATIHAIKGLEAKVVFIIGCNEQNFPCKASDHPIIEMIKIEDYDKEEEEKRLFYVALSRAKENLHLTNGRGKFTRFLTDRMKELIDS